VSVIPRQQVEAYATIIDRAQRNAGSRARSLVSKWIGKHPGASADEVRSASIEILTSVADEYGNAAASAACDLYDLTMWAEDIIDLPRAEPAEADRAGIERAVRYQLRKYLDGDIDGYLKAIQDAAHYHVRRQASKTTIKNAERDNRYVLRGGLGDTEDNQRYGPLHQATAEVGYSRRTRFPRRRYSGGALQPGDIAYARVPTGAETCTYCMMLASRGFAYHTEESAGHADHRGCNCLIVAGVHGSTTVQGVDLQEQYDTWKEMATADARHDKGELSDEEWQAQKRAIVDSHPGATAGLEAAGTRKSDADAMGPRQWYVPKEYKGYARTSGYVAREEEALVRRKKGATNGFSVNYKAVNNKGYHDKYNDLPMPKATREQLYKAAGEILNDRDGTSGERMFAIDIRDGTVVASTMSYEPHDLQVEFNSADKSAIAGHGNRVVFLHNHPGDSPPSSSDIRSAVSNPNVSASVICGHKGSVYLIEPLKKDANIGDIWDNFLESAMRVTTEEDEAEMIALSWMNKENENQLWYRITEMN